MEPSHFGRRLKMLFPLCEHYAYQEVSPYVILLTGPTTVANLFYNINIAIGKVGLAGLWDAVGFDEVVDLQKMSKEVATSLK
jgi:ATP-dependent Lon protease